MFNIPVLYPICPLFLTIMENLKIVITQDDVDRYNRAYFAAHPRAKKLRIKGPEHPSLNWYMTANNMAVNDVKQDWKQFIINILEDRGLLNLEIDKCVVYYTTYFKRNKNIDADNITPKFILDGLVAGGFLVDDSIRHIALFTQGFYDAKNPRIELEFKNIQRKGEKENGEKEN